MARSMTLGVDAGSVLVIGTGGEARARTIWEDGKNSGKPQVRDGGELRALSGVAVSIAGVGLDGATVTTVTPMDAIPAGVIFRASGTCEVTVRADVRPGFGGSGPRGEIASTVYIEKLEPVAQATDVLKSRRGEG